MGRRTGIIFNNAMFSFSKPGIQAMYSPQNEANYIAPGKRPLTSMSPSVVTDENGDVIMSVGGSGGVRINAVVAMVNINYITCLK